MKIQIRNGAFETNSSSMHSLVIRDMELLDENEENEYATFEDVNESFDRYIYNDGKELNFTYVDAYYGRYPFRVLYRPWEKFLYAWACSIYDESFSELMHEFLNEFFPDVITVKEPEHFGADENYYNSWKRKYNFTLKDFICNNRYVVICDGDEYCLFDSLRKSNLIDEDMNKINRPIETWGDDDV